MNNKENMCLAAGTVLHGDAYDYKIMRVLGQGSFGITYQAKVEMKGALGKLDSNMCVAVKEFFMREVNGRENSEVTSSSSTTDGLFCYYRDKFEREARNLGTLAHPNIVKVLESFHANGTVYYAMEYVEGRSLDKTIADAPHGRLSLAEARGYARQIGDALECMHSRGMLHLDVKPANVMVRGDGSAVLIDFGLSKQYGADGEPESSTKVGAGTPGYAPIEQASYREGKGFPVMMDVYALGATVFKMLTGQRPPEASEILNDGFPYNQLSLAGVTDAVAGVLAKAMAPLKKDRYQTVSRFLAALDHPQLAAGATADNADDTDYSGGTTHGSSVSHGGGASNGGMYVADAEPRWQAPHEEDKTILGDEDLYDEYEQGQRAARNKWIIAAVLAVLGVAAAALLFVGGNTSSGTVAQGNSEVVADTAADVAEQSGVGVANASVDNKEDRLAEAVPSKVGASSGVSSSAASSAQPQHGDETASQSANVSFSPQTDRNDKEADTPSDRVYDVVEHMPSFPGGNSSLMRFLSENIQYPAAAQENGVQGRVVVSFVVEKNGAVTNVHVVRSVDPYLDKEAMRVVRSMPKWLPGKQSGSAVRVKYNVPVSFRLN